MWDWQERDGGSGRKSWRGRDQKTMTVAVVEGSKDEIGEIDDTPVRKASAHKKDHSSDDHAA